MEKASLGDAIITLLMALILASPLILCKAAELALDVINFFIRS